MAKTSLTFAILRHACERVPGVGHEYKIVVVESLDEAASAERELSALSADGWEFVSVLTGSGHLSPSGYGNLIQSAILLRRSVD